MFKFDFQVDQDDTESPFTNCTGDSNNKNDRTEPPLKTTEWYDSEEIIPSCDLLENIDVCKLNSIQKDFKDVSLYCIVAGSLLEDIKENGDEVLDIKKAEENHSDLIAGVYEGGAKIWECTDDLLFHLAENIPHTEWQGKAVLDLGCGSGLLGIYAFKNGSKVTFQDYNKDVLEKITIPNVLLNTMEITEDDEETYNIERVKENARFYSGDWQKFSELPGNNQLLYDIILTSETIYNPQNHQKLLNCLCDKLKDDGKVYVAAKTYYFGVGGGLRQFEQLIGKDQRFNYKSVWLSTEGVNREIIVLTKKSKEK